MIEEKLDKLTAAVERLTAVIESGGAAPAASGKPAAAEKPKAAAKPAAAKKAKFTADQVKARFAELKANEAIGAPPLKELISNTGCENLAELLVSPDKFEDAMAAMDALEAGVGDDLDAGGEDDEL
jgi:pyruvate/2-oxoglutarate dehydrogenase complex dihydrolipoamide acyltransferase (E2) component